MKKLKVILSALIVLALFLGLYIKDLKSVNEITETEFLFDTVCSITVFSKADQEAAGKAFDEAARLHALADFFDRRSEVSKINNAESGEKIELDKDIFNMLKIALDIEQKSDGAFDVTIAPISQLWSFDKDTTVCPSDAEIKEQLLYVGSKTLRLDGKSLTLTKESKRVKINLGGIAKGYAADRTAEVLRACGVKSALIDFGGNIVTVGENPKTENKKWRIGLQKPFAPTGEYSKVIELDPGSTAVTSGTYQRYFEIDGKIYHHIIDPETGYPAGQNFDSVTVVCDNAALSDALATAIFVMGEENGRQLAQQYGADVYFLNK